MRIIVLIILIISFSIKHGIGQQTFSVSVADRNKAIQLTKDAILDIQHKDYNEALGKLLKSCKIDSTFRETYIRIYQVGSLKHEKFDIIIAAINKGKRVFQEDDELFYYCGEIYRLDSKYNKAIIEYTEAMKYAKVNGEDYYLVPYYYLKRGNVYLKTEKYNLAIKDYNYLLFLDSNFKGGLTNRGIAFYKIGEKDKACNDWHKAIETGASDAMKYYQKHCIN